MRLPSLRTVRTPNVFLRTLRTRNVLGFDNGKNIHFAWEVYFGYRWWALVNRMFPILLRIRREPIPPSTLICSLTLLS